MKQQTHRHTGILHYRTMRNPGSCRSQIFNDNDPQAHAQAAGIVESCNSLSTQYKTVAQLHGKIAGGVQS